MGSLGLSLTPQHTPQTNVFAGADYEAPRDARRLLTQIRCIHDLAIDGQWRTIQKLTAALRKRHPQMNFPENSVQAQLRNLRKIGFAVERRNTATKGFLAEYRLLPPVNPGVGAEQRKAVLCA